MWLTKAREATLLANLLDDVSIEGISLPVESITITGGSTGGKEKEGKSIWGKGKEKGNPLEGISVSTSTTTSVSYEPPPRPASSHAQQPSTASSINCIRSTLRDVTTGKRSRT